MRPRQSVYMACTALHAGGSIDRGPDQCDSCNRVKILSASPRSASRPASAVLVETRPLSATPSAEPIDARPWCWEGHVQSRIVAFLRSAGSGIVSEAETASRQPGKDIVALDTDGRPLWVTVKGWPEGSPNVQARHWFAGALLDLALYRTQDAGPRLAMGLPRGFTTYEGLVKRTADTLHFLGCHVFWVAEDGTVTREVPRTKAPGWSD